MAGRIGYWLIAAGAIVGGMALQGDLNFGDGHSEHAARQALAVSEDREIDRAVDRIVDRGADKIVISGQDGQTLEADPALKRALAAAVAELVRAEGSLIAVRLDEATPSAAIEQAEHRRDAARHEVERLSETAKTEARVDRDVVRARIRDEVRDSVREAVRS